MELNTTSVTNDEFKESLTKFKYYLKPALFTVLVENVDVFSEVTKKEIIDKLIEADRQMQGLYDYQEKRNGVIRRGLEKIDEIYSKAKSRFRETINHEKRLEASEADRLISNL